MTIHVPDEDLLLLTHRALPTGRSALIRLHLLLCPSCRARLHRFERVSRMMAGAVREPKMPLWPGPVAALSLPTVAGWLLLLVVTLTLTTLIITGVAHHAHQSMMPTPSHATGGCRPDLPSDQCR